MGGRIDRRVHKRRYKWEEVIKKNSDVGRTDGWIDGLDRKEGMEGGRWMDENEDGRKGRKKE